MREDDEFLLIAFSVKAILTVSVVASTVDVYQQC